MLIKVKWIKPDVGWFKPNSNGSSQISSGLARVEASLEIVMENRSKGMLGLWAVLPAPWQNFRLLKMG